MKFHIVIEPWFSLVWVYSERHNWLSGLVGPKMGPSRPYVPAGDVWKEVIALHDDLLQKYGPDVVIDNEDVVWRAYKEQGMALV